MKLKKWLKGIWNFFFPEKKKEYIVGYRNIKGKPVPLFSNIKPKDNNEKAAQEIIAVTKNEYRKAQLRKGFEARYSGKEKHFYLHKTHYPCPN